MCQGFNYPDHNFQVHAAGSQRYRLLADLIGTIELSADSYWWAAGAQRGILNGLFWSKLSAAGRCWCGGSLLPYKLSETICSHHLLWAAKAPIQLRLNLNVKSPRRPARPNSLFLVSPSLAESRVETVPTLLELNERGPVNTNQYMDVIMPQS